jgi:hypothetical protein
MRLYSRKNRSLPYGDGLPDRCPGWANYCGKQQRALSDSIELRNQLRQFIEGYSLEPVKDYDSLIANLERVEKEVKEQQQDTGNLPPTPVSPRMTPAS